MTRKKSLTGLAALAGLCLFLWWQNNGLTVSRYEHRAEWVRPGLDGFTIVHLSDLHNHRFGPEQRALLARTAELAPDLIVITGDLVDSRHTNLEPALELVWGLAGSAPVFYVTGNHEQAIPAEKREELLDGLAAAGVVLLDDRITVLETAGGPVTLAGLSDESLRDDTLAELIGAAEPGNPVLLLAHEPQFLEHYASAGANLVFSGHADVYKRQEEGSSGADPLLPQGEGDGSPLREVLQADADGQRHGRGETAAAVLGSQGEGQAHRHPLRDVVQGDGQHHQGGPAPGGGQALGLVSVGVQVGEQTVQAPQEQHPQKKAARGGEPAVPPGGLRLLNGRDQQTEYRGGHHYAGGEPQKHPLKGGAGPPADKQYGGRAQHGHQTGDARADSGP